MTNTETEVKTIRKDDGKLRYDLIEPYQIQELAKVYSAGAKKYADHNWLKSGMTYSRMLASAKRHIAAFEMGEDFDPEMTEKWGEPIHHLACAAWNILGIVSYSKYFPEQDNRLVKTLLKQD